MKKLFLFFFAAAVATGCSGDGQPPIPSQPSDGPELRFSQAKKQNARPAAKRRNRAAEKIFIPDTQIMR